MGRKVGRADQEANCQSAALLQSTLGTIGKTAKATVTVRNLYFGESERFLRWNESKTRKDFIAGGGLEMALPDLLDSIVGQHVHSSRSRSACMIRNRVASDSAPKSAEAGK